ncbi:Cilia- and flagella-associated protein 36 [Paramecium bursaria]
MLLSPEWQSQYNSFVEENCIFFQESDENDMHHNQLFKNFQKEMASVYDQFMQNLGLDNEELQQEVIKELIKSNEIDVDQLLALGDYEVFKAEMSYQNKLREIQAFKQLVGDEQEDSQGESSDDDYRIESLKVKLEYEQLEEEIVLQIAVEMSLEEPDQDKLNLLQEQLARIRNHLSVFQNTGHYEDRKEMIKTQLANVPQINVEEAKKNQEDIKKQLE